jgi:hypothetical protein
MKESSGVSIPLQNNVMWPHKGETVRGHWSGRLGIVKDTKIKYGKEMALIRWIHTTDGDEDWIYVDNLRAV